MNQTQPQQEAVRLGRLVAVLYEEGLLEKLGLEPHEVGLSLSKERPLQILTPALQLRGTLSAADRLATITGTDFLSTPLSDEDLLAFYQSYDATLCRLIGRRRFMFTQQVQEVI